MVYLPRKISSFDLRRLTSAGWLGLMLALAVPLGLIGWIGGNSGTPYGTPSPAILFVVSWLGVATFWVTRGFLSCFGVKMIGEPWAPATDYLTEHVELAGWQRYFAMLMAANIVEFLLLLLARIAPSDLASTLAISLAILLSFVGWIYPIFVYHLAKAAKTPALMYTVCSCLPLLSLWALWAVNRRANQALAETSRSPQTSITSSF
jgi:hypothetical protein